QTRNHFQGATERGRTDPLLLDLETGSWSGGIGETFNIKAIRTSAAVKASFFLGRHTLKTGLDYEDNFSDENSYRVGPGNDGPQTVGGLGIIIRTNDSLYQAYTGIWKAKVHNRIPALFIQDAWQINPRFLLQLGLRWSSEYMIGTDGKLAQTISNEFQPRIGFVFQPGDLGLQKIYGSYG
ncbi:MAG: TonB-dependent receptor, partial [Desulfobulbaceae bacterium]|nr:TonB-dependent receptor [Desulfobulbaceae bacterium]